MNQPFNRTINHSLICIILQLLQNIFTFLGLSKWIYHRFKDGMRLSNVRKSQVLPPKKTMQITKTSYLLMGYTGITNSLWTSSKSLSASVFDLFVQSADSCRLCGMIFLSEAPRFLALKIIKSHGKRSLIQILLTQEWIWESQNSSCPFK